MTRRRKWLLAILALFGALILALGIAVIIIGRDEAPPDDSDMLVQRLDIPDQENGFTFILQAEAALYYPGTDAWTNSGLHPEPPDDATTEADQQAADAAMKVEYVIDAMVQGDKWDDALAAEILEHNAKTIELFNKAMACPHFQSPKIGSINQGMPWAFECLSLARMLSTRATALAKQGDDEAALQQAADLVQFGHAISRAKGIMVKYLIGLTVKGMGLDATRRLLKTTVLPPARLKALADRLGGCVNSDEDLANCFRAEYEMDIGTIDENMPKVGDPSMESWRWVPGLNGIIWKPNETRRMLLDTFRPLTQAGHPPASQTQWDPVAEKENYQKKGIIGKILTGNMAGHTLFAIILPSIHGIRQLDCRTKTETTFTQTLVALKAFQTKNGRLPQTLKELVPEFLAAVPLDGFDGEPLRYSPTKKVVYSVGEDGVDAGGMTPEEAREWWEAKMAPSPDEPWEPRVWELPNPSFSIEF